MNNAIKRFRPSSSWVTATLLTLFVISFAIFAEKHAPAGSASMFFANPTLHQPCETSGIQQNRTLIRYY